MAKITYPDLPITQYVQAIKDALKTHAVVIVAGETGSGKTTQLPKICVEAGLGAQGRIGHTQPRRLAARTIAERIAEEMQTPLGDFVGFKTRFQEKMSPGTVIKVMTDGILLAEIQNDKWLRAYDCIIIDEAHERSLNIDFLLGFLHKLLKRRNDLKVIITSATIEHARFSAFFNNAPIVSVEGRSYPVTVHYLTEEEARHPFHGMHQALAYALTQSGDILIFQSGEREINDTLQELRFNYPRIEAIALFARQNAAEQKKAFLPSSRRKIIVTTNVAETSITVPNIHFVIDFGTARISRYNARTKLQRLPIEPISQASANQRKGRAGRIAPGVCFRLYTEADFLSRPAYTTPEILRTHLAGVLLNMLSWKIKDILAFPFLDPLDTRFIKDGLGLLFRLGAITTDNEITPLGTHIAQLPLDPKLARALVEAGRTGCLKEMAVIVSGLSIQDPRERPAGARTQADQAHAIFNDRSSDFLSLLKIWKAAEEARRSNSGKDFKKWCQKHYLSFVRICEWRDVYAQCCDTMKELGYKLNHDSASDIHIHQALLPGFLDNIGQLTEKNEYIGLRGMKFHLFPGSAVFKKPPKWVMAAEIVHTTKTYARMLGKIECEWILKAAHHLLKRDHQGEHFDPELGKVMTFEITTLFGLVLTKQKRVVYDPINLMQARHIFIQQALCEEHMTTSFAFMTHNKQILSRVLQLEDRIRRKVTLFAPELVYAFYDARLPADITSTVALSQWLKTQSSTVLTLRSEDIMAHPLDTQWLLDFPNTLTLDTLTFPVKYIFDLSSEWDGATLQVPVQDLPALMGIDLSWGISGVLEEKIAFMLKSLPKSLRAMFPPGALSSLLMREPLAEMRAMKGSLPIVLKQYIEKQYGIALPPAVWKQLSTPAFLNLHIAVLSKFNECLAQGNDATLLFQEIKAKNPHIFEGKSLISATDIFKSWPENVPVLPTGHSFVDKMTGVQVQVFLHTPEGEKAHAAGLTRLYLLLLTSIQKKPLQDIPRDQKQLYKRIYSSWGTEADLYEAILFASVYHVFVEGRAAIRSVRDFEHNFVTHQSKFSLCLTAMRQCVGEILKGLDVWENIVSMRNVHPDGLSILKEEMGLLLPLHFIQETPWEWLKRYPLYIKVKVMRLEKFSAQIAKERQFKTERLYIYKLVATDITLDPTSDTFMRVKWLLEELAISYFAQNFKTILPISFLRLQKILKENL